MSVLSGPQNPIELLLDLSTPLALVAPRQKSGASPSLLIWPACLRVLICSYIRRIHKSPVYQGVPEIVIETNSEMVQGSPDVDRTQNPTIIFPVQSAIAWENHRALGPPGATCWGHLGPVFSQGPGWRLLHHQLRWELLHRWQKVLGHALNDSFQKCWLVSYVFRWCITRNRFEFLKLLSLVFWL